MKNRNILIKFLLCFSVMSLVQCANIREIRMKKNFMNQVNEYLDSCSFNYYKIREAADIVEETEYEYQAFAIIDSLAKLYPDSVEFGMVINDIPPEHEFKIQGWELAKIDESLQDEIRLYSLLVEFESNGSCCDKLICAAYFKFDNHLKLFEVEEAQSPFTFHIYDK